MSCQPKMCLGRLKDTIEILERVLVSAEPGLAEPVHDYTTKFAPRAEIKTKAGTSEFSRLVIDGKGVTHVMTIRYTALPFDSRDRVRDRKGSLYAILRIENIDEQDEWLKLYCMKKGSEDREAVR